MMSDERHFGFKKAQIENFLKEEFNTLGVTRVVWMIMFGLE